MQQVRVHAYSEEVNPWRRYVLANGECCPTGVTVGEFRPVSQIVADVCNGQADWSGWSRPERDLGPSDPAAIEPCSWRPVLAWLVKAADRFREKEGGGAPYENQQACHGSS